MYIIRLQRIKDPKKALKYKIIVIKKGSAVHSQAYSALLGYYNKDSNIVKVRIDLLYQWLGLGANLSTPAKRLLGSMLKI